MKFYKPIGNNTIPYLLCRGTGQLIAVEIMGNINKYKYLPIEDDESYPVKLESVDKYVATSNRKNNKFWEIDTDKVHLSDFYKLHHNIN